MGHTVRWCYILTVGLKEENRSLRVSNESLAKENKSLSDSSKTLSDATYRFFEARVAVMGFKCRTMQLQGELDELVSNDGSYSMRILPYCIARNFGKVFNFSKVTTFKIVNFKLNAYVPMKL